MDDIFTFDTPQGAEDARHAYDNAENALSPTCSPRFDDTSGL